MARPGRSWICSTRWREDGGPALTGCILLGLRLPGVSGRARLGGLNDTTGARSPPLLTATRCGPVLAAALLAWHTAPAGAQPSFQNYAIEDGLPHSQVRALLQDSRGYLWVGTLGGGLGRFDGRNFETFTTRQGLADDRVYALAEDQQGRLWIGTEHGLTIYDAGALRSPSPDLDRLGSVRAVLASRRGVFLGSENGLLHLQGGEGGPVREIQEFGGVGVGALLEDRDGRVWVGTLGRGLAVLEGDRLSWVNGTAGWFVRDLLEARQGRIWAATSSGLFGVDGGRIEAAGLPPLPSGGGAGALVEDSDGSLWVGTDDAGVCRRAEDRTSCYSEEEGLGSNHVWALARDHEGSIWVGTYRGGLSRFLGGERLPSGLARELNGVVVRSILQDRRGRLWFATDDRGVLILDGSATRWLRERQGLANDFVLTLFEDRAGVMWIGTFKGLSRYDGRTFRTFTKADGLGDDVVRSIVEDADGTMWIATNEGGVSRFDGRRLRTFNRSAGLNSGAVNALCVDGAGRLWAGTALGLNLFEAGRFRDASREFGLTAGSVHSIREDPRTGDLWLGVFGEGLVRLPRGLPPRRGAQGVEPQTFGAPNVLSSDRVVSLVFDSSGDLWVGSETGIDRLRLDRQDPTRPPALAAFGEARGSGRVEPIHNAAFADSSGRVWFGTLRGPRLFDAARREDWEARPVIRMTAIGPAPGDWSWTPWLQEKDRRIELAPDENRLALLVEAISFRASHRLRYQFRMEGLAGAWSEPSLYPEVFYARLPAGDYTASARVSADDHTWVEAPAPFHFRVLAPFWRRGWFYAGSLLLTVFAVYGGHRLAVARLTSHERELKGEVAVRKRAEQALRESEQTLRGLLNATSDAVLLLDSEGTIVALNDRASDTLDGAPTAPLGRNVFDLLPPPLAQTRRHQLVEVTRSGRRVRFEDRQDGIWFDHILTPLVDAAGLVRRVAVFSRDVTAQKEAEARLQHDAFHDPLTGLANRALFVERLEWAIRRAARNPNRHFAVLFLDLDRFKLVNDSLGHEAGNHVLKSIAPRLEACLRASDTCARLGGDEFVILLDESQSAIDAAEVAQRILRRLWEPFEIDGRAVTLSSSIGIATSHTGYARAEDILRDVDIAMYRAKELGRSRIEIFDLEMRTRAMARFDLEGSLERAAERGELRIFYQPIVSLAEGYVQGFEALVRWRHPERGLLLPSDFVPIAEGGRLIGAIDSFVLREACRQLRQWHESLPVARGLTINVNTSGRLFSEGDLAALVERILLETGLPPHFLQLEITESALMQSMATAAETLRRLRSLGVRVAVDDFGVGYSSLAYLVQLPVDTLKIDRAFIAQLAGPPGREQIVETIVAMGQKLGTSLIAEGIETVEQRERLLTLGCGSGQGYLFSEPLEADAAAALVTPAGTTGVQAPGLATCSVARWPRFG